jgi:hypothetical protein
MVAGRLRWRIVLGLATCIFAAGIVKAQTSRAAQGACRIAGTAVDAASGRPLGRVEVTIGLIAGEPLRQTYSTGADGRFLFDGLPAGRYELSARRRGYVEQKYRGHENYWSAIVTGPGLRTDEIRFAMTAGASITGHVLDEHGEPIRDGRVLLLEEVLTGRGRRLTRNREADLNDLGAYRFGHLEPGSYVVAVITRPWYAERYGVNPRKTEGLPRSGDVDTEVAYPVTFYPGATDAETAGRITLTPGENATADLTLAPTEGRSATVERDSDDPNGAVGLVSVEQYIAAGITETIDPPINIERGRITLIGLPPSRVDVMWRSGSGKNAQEHLTSVNVSGKDTENSSVPTVIRGVLEGTGRMKLAGTTVKLVFGVGGGKSYSATVGTKGEFEFREELLSGLYSIQIPQLSDVQLGVRLKGAEFFGGSMEIQPGGEIELRISAGIPGRVRGRVVKGGAAAEGIFVALVPQGFEDANNLMRVGESDSSGAFEIESVVPGKYTLIALENAWDGDWRSAEFLRRFVGEGKKLEIGNGATVTTDVEVQDGSGK